MVGVYHVDEMLLHVRRENNEQMMNDNEENHTHKFFDNHYSWLWNLMDSTTRFWICSRLSQRRDIQAGVALLKEMKNARHYQKHLFMTACGYMTTLTTKNCSH